MPTSSTSNACNEELFILNYATRLFMAITNKKTFIQAVLETFADFGKTSRVGILLVDNVTGKLTPAGLYAKGVFSFPHPVVPETASNLLTSHEIRQFPLADTPFPLPSEHSSSPSVEEHCLCVPIAHASDNISALITMTTHAGELDFEALQQLRVISSVCALSLENMRLFEMAIFDGLTGVHVRRYFEIKANEELAKMQRNPSEMGIILMDIDDFKGINDRFGHVNGDEVLIEFAMRICEAVRKDIDIVCRYGGDEFVVLLPQTGLEQTRTVAQRILTAVHGKPYRALSADQEVSISAGAMTVGHGEDITTQELVRRVDQLLYAGKQSGGNKVISMEGENIRKARNNKPL